MSDTLYVTPAQVLAAKLALELNEEAGEPPDEALQAIANARVVATQESGPGPRTSAGDQALATLQRIEHQLQQLNPEASTQERSQPPTQLESLTSIEQADAEREIQDQTLANIDPDLLNDPPPYSANQEIEWDYAADVPELTDANLRQFEWNDEVAEPPVGAHADEPLVGERAWEVSEAEVDAILREREAEQGERPTGQGDRGMEKPDRPRDDPGSGGPER
jgi:hypothetical protein